MAGSNGGKKSGLPRKTPSEACVLAVLILCSELLSDSPSSAVLGESLDDSELRERFEEDDNRLRTSKQLCHRDPGLATLDGVPLEDLFVGVIEPGSSQFEYQVRSQYSQGCLPKSLFDTGNPADPNDNGAYGTPNGNALPFVRGGRGGSFTIGNAPFPGDPDCISSTIV